MRWVPFANEDNNKSVKIVDYWNKANLPPQLTPPHYFMMRVPIGAQFIVSKERITRHPKEAWQNWLNMVLEDGTKDISIFFEYIFHIIFGEFWRLEMHDDWFSFKTVPPVWHQPIPEDVYAKQLFKIMTLDTLNATLAAQGWKWN